MNMGQVWSQHLHQLNWQELKLYHGLEQGEGVSRLPSLPFHNGSS